MKTTKEYAIELVEKYDETLTYLESKAKAKQCALIAVEMLMSEIILLNAGRVYKQFDRERLEYLSEVKQEIEKL